MYYKKERLVRDCEGKETESKRKICTKQIFVFFMDKVVEKKYYKNENLVLEKE